MNENRKYYLDGPPIETLTYEERKKLFDRQIGPDLDKLSEEDIQLMKKFYRINEID